MCAPFTSESTNGITDPPNRRIRTLGRRCFDDDGSGHCHSVPRDLRGPNTASAFWRQVAAGGPPLPSWKAIPADVHQCRRAVPVKMACPRRRAGRRQSCCPGFHFSCIDLGERMGRVTLEIHPPAGMSRSDSSRSGGATNRMIPEKWCRARTNQGRIAGTMGRMVSSEPHKLLTFQGLARRAGRRTHRRCPDR
jgi:hypothetical protein